MSREPEARNVGVCGPGGVLPTPLTSKAAAPSWSHAPGSAEPLPEHSEGPGLVFGSVPPF